MANDPIPGTKSNSQLTNEIRLLRERVEALTAMYNVLKSEMDSKPKLSDISRSESNLTKMVNDNAADITRVERQLAMVVLPDTPRYYLTQDEITSFQTNLSKLLAMMTSFERLYQNLVSYSANLST